jgi:glycosyltransferase involved in cell wall biosynthesis
MGTKKQEKIKVVFFTRKTRPLGNFSVEMYFRLIKDNLSENFDVIIKEMPFYSNGLLRRLGNAIYCFFNQAEINHITGDIHYVAYFLSRKKTVLTILDCGMLHQSKGIKFFIFKWLWFKIPIWRVNKITAISEATKIDIIKYSNCKPSKIEVIYVCINPNFRENRKEFNFDKPRILQIGSAPNKNLKKLIPALSEINCNLTIVGKINEEIINLLKRHNLEFQVIDKKLSDQEVIEEYNKCDILSLISTLEGFGMPIIEANAVGRVVITANNSSMPEIAGNSAKLVDALDIQAIRNGFMEIINKNDYRNSLIENGYENTKRFEPKKIAIQFEKLYQQVLIG